MNKPNYYMIITTPSSYKKDILNNFSLLGFPDRNEKSVRNFKKKDKVVFYVTQVSVFASIVEITGDYYYEKTNIWDIYDYFPHRVKSKAVHKITKVEDAVKATDLLEDLSFITNKKYWGGAFQGSFKRLSKEDYSVIEKAIRTKNK